MNHRIIYILPLNEVVEPKGFEPPPPCLHIMLPLAQTSPRESPSKRLQQAIT